jgi:hypothetical protein
MNFTEFAPRLRQSMGTLNGGQPPPLADETP